MRLSAFSFVIFLLIIPLFWHVGCTPAQRFRSADGQKEKVDLKNKVRTAARAWLGTPYRYGGNDRKGIDCSALACRIYRQAFNIKLPRQTSLQRKEGYAVPLSRLEAGDLLFFRFHGFGGVNHVGVYLGDNRFIHASSERGVVISNLKDRYYRRHLVTARRCYR